MPYWELFRCLTHKQVGIKDLSARNQNFCASFLRDAVWEVVFSKAFEKKESICILWQTSVQNLPHHVTSAVISLLKEAKCVSYFVRDTFKGFCFSSQFLRWFKWLKLYSLTHSRFLSVPHPTWSWTLPMIGQPQLLWEIGLIVSPLSFLPYVQSKPILFQFKTIAPWPSTEDPGKKSLLFL